MLKGALASLDCALFADHAYDSHSILVGKVQGVLLKEASVPLLYFDGGFHTLQ